MNPKHFATFLLGAAAGVAVSKYMSMSDEEKEKFMADLKDKARGMKDEAEKMADKAKDYFEELRAKGSETFKDQMSDAESFFDDLFGKKTKPASEQPPAS